MANNVNVGQDSMHALQSLFAFYLTCNQCTELLSKYEIRHCESVIAATRDWSNKRAMAL